MLYKVIPNKNQTEEHSLLATTFSICHFLVLVLLCYYLGKIHLLYHLINSFFSNKKMTIYKSGGFIFEYYDTTINLLKID